MKLWQYQQLFRPVPRPGGEPETIYDGAWHRPQNEPRRNFTVSQRAALALIAAAPFFFFQPPPIVADIQTPIAQPYLRVAPRAYAQTSYLFFQDAPASLSVPANFVQPPNIQPYLRVAPRGYATAPYFFFQPYANVSDFFGSALSQPQFRTPSRLHTSAYYFAPQFVAAEFTDQTFVAIEQPFPRLRDPRYRYPSLSFQENPTAAAFSDQTYNSLEGPKPRVELRYTYPSFFTVQVPTFDFPVENSLLGPLRKARTDTQTAPYFFAPVPPPGQEAEVIYLPGWYQPIGQPARNQAFQLLYRTWLGAVAPSLSFQGEITAVPFTTFGVITRNLPMPGMTVYFEATLKTDNATYPAQARLYNITDATVVSSSTISTASLTPVRVRSIALTLPTLAKEYRVEFGGQASVGATYTIYSGDLIFGG